MAQETHDDEDRSIRRIALKILNEDEDEARDELDKVVYGVEDSIELKANFYSWSHPVLFTLPAIFLVLLIATGSFSNVLGKILFGMATLCTCVPLLVFWYWRHFHYGRGKLRAARPAIYLGDDDETKEKLEKLFSYLQRESSPRAYYRATDGTARYLDYNFTFGSLRFLLFSSSPSVRALYLSPRGGRLSEVIKIDADPREIIKALFVKPKRKGGPGIKLKYPYVDAILWLSGEPKLIGLDLSNQELAIQTITKWLSEWFTANVDESGDAPRNERLKDYAEKIYNWRKKTSPPGRND